MPDVEDGLGSALPVGLWDMLLLFSFAGFVIYWFWVRDPKPESEKISKFNLTSTGGNSTDKSFASFIDKMIFKGQKVAIFYGSQTGTATDYSARLLKDIRRMGLGCTQLDPEDHDPKDLARLTEIEDSLVLFVVATYGEGDPTDNARQLFDFLSDMDSADQVLAGVRFAVFGLGNKTYEHYNLIGRFVDKKVAEHGGERFFRRGDGDDDGNIEEDFLVWREEFLDCVRERYQITAEQVGMIREYELVVHDPPPPNVYVGEPVKLGSFRNQRPVYNNKNPYLAPITVHKELHKGGDRSCMHIELDITGSKITYSPGDHVAIQPVNDSAMVQEIGGRLNIDLDTIISLKATEDSSANKVNPFPCPCTYRTAFTHYVDISSFPRTNVLESMIEYCQEDPDREQLRRVTTPGEGGRLAYNGFIRVNGRNLLDVLKELPSLAPPADLLLEMLPRLQLRYYSISSSPKMYPNSIHVTATTHDYETLAGRRGSGVATSWLRSLQDKVGASEARVPVYRRKSTLRLPMRSAIPAIMVGPGTGLAPFRAFIQERHLLKESGKMVGETRLYFGCRHRAVDYLYQDELESYEASGSLTLRAAFSRDQAEKIYVSDLLRQDSADIWNLLNVGNAHFYVCGDARSMARDVNQTLLEIVQEQGGKSAEDAELYIKSLKQRGRYVVDAWS